MDKRHRFFSLILMSVALFVLWLSAHDFYVARINQQQQSLIHELQRGSHDLNWPLKSTSDVVAGFGSGWVMQPQGLHIKTQTAEISLAFNDRFMVADLYHVLTFKWRGDGAEDSQLMLEFSQVDLGVFYYSEPISVHHGLNRINLGQLSWTAKQGSKSETVSWHQLPALNTLVWRFFQPQGQVGAAFLSQITIPQSVALQHPAPAMPLTAVLSNQLRHQWQDQRLRQGLVLASPPVMQPHLAIAPWFLFAIGVLCLMVAAQICQRSVGVKTGAFYQGNTLIVLVLVMVVLMQTSPLFKALEAMPWLAIVVLMLPSVLLVKRWFRPRQVATPIWVITLVTSGVMAFVSDGSWGFIGDLPVYLVWALAQQVILGPWVSDYLHHQASWSKGAVVLLCGVLFALLHFPNQMLMVATFIGGLLWSYAWLRYRNIYANAVSHALLALLFYQSMPEHLLGSARVGLWF